MSSTDNTPIKELWTAAKPAKIIKNTRKKSIKISHQNRNKEMIADVLTHSTMLKSATKKHSGFSQMMILFLALVRNVNVKICMM